MSSDSYPTTQPVQESFPDQSQPALTLDADHFSVYEYDVTPGHGHEHLSVRWGGRELLKHEIPIKTPSYPYGMIKFCIWGAGDLDFDGERREMEPGMVMWSLPKHPSVLTARRGIQMSNFAVLLAGNEMPAEMERYLHVPVGVAKLSQFGPIRDAFQALMDEGRGTAQHREENCALLVRLLLRRIDAHSTASLVSNSLARQTFKRCRECIEKNFSKLTTLREVAEACDVTVPYLCRLFDQFFHCSPYDYMTRLKMSRAESLLLRPTAPVSEVASAVGYKDAKLFARNFKATFGKSPTKYRSRM